MKKLSIFLLALAASVGTMFASDTQVDSIWYNFDDGNLTAEVTYQGDKYNSYSDEYSGAVVIPSSVTYNAQTYTVTSIGKEAFYGCSGLTSVTIPNSVTSIGKEAFRGCYSLTSVTIPNNVTSIGSYAFYGCSGLTSVTIPNSVTSIGKEAFRGCYSLTSVTIPNNVTSIGNYAFSGCSGLTSVTIPNSVTSIEEGAFAGCAGLTSIDVASDNSNYCSVDGVLFNKDKTTLIQYPGGKQGAYTIPNSVTSIGKSAFSRCYGLTSIEIPDSVTSIGDGAFSGCSGLTSITIPNSVTSIGDGAFSGCSGLTSITIPNSVKSIGNYAFYECSGLTSIEIPDSVTSIGDNAFCACYSLASIEIPNSVTSIGFGAFQVCYGLTSVTIPNSVTSIGEYAFGACYSLASVTIPNSVTYIAQGAFAWCTSLNSINVANDNTNYISIEGVLFAIKTKTILKQYPAGKQGAYTIPNNVTSIGSRAFEGSSGLTSVVIPNGVTNIGSRAFYGCSSLTSVTNYATTPQGISSNVFEEVNKSVCTLYVPAESVEAYQTANGWGVFGNILAIEDEPAPCIIASGTCGAEGDNLTWTLTCDSVLTISGTGAMAEYTSIELVPWFVVYHEAIKSVIIGEEVINIGNYAFSGCSGLTSVTIPNSVTSIEEGAFADCAGLTSVTIPNSVTSIGEWAFSGCSGLTSIDVASDNSNYCSVDGVLFNKDKTTLIQYPGGKQGAYTIPNSVTSIGEWAFSGCSGLTSIEIPNSVTSIGEWAFSGCSGLTSIEIPNSVTNIGIAAFEYCSGLTSVTIPNSVTSIEQGAFYGCNGLTSVTIGNSVTSIGSYAFYYCTGLTSVTNYATTPQGISSNVFEEVNKSVCTLYVPAESLAAYQAADVWKEFGNILAIEDEPAPCVIASGTCGAQGDNLTWTLSCDSVLTISGTGAMAEYTSIELVPWLVVYHEAIKSVIIGEEVINIGNYAFSGCSGLTSVTIGNSVTSIGKSAFRYCSGLTSVTMPNSVTSIGSSAFSRCSNLISVTISDSVTSIGDYAFYECIGLISVEIPNSVTNIEDLAFSSCINLASVTIPNSVTSIGDYAFYNCYGLTSIIVENGNTVYDSRNNCNAIVKTATNTLILGCKNTTIPNSVTLIGNSAFSNCHGLTSITIPDSVTGIGNHAFSNCHGLTSVTIPNSVTSIGKHAFSGCSGLTSIEIPNSVTSIEEGAFADCAGLTSITIPNSVTSIGKHAFYYCTGLTSVTNYATTPQGISSNVFEEVNKSVCTLYVPAESVDAYKAADIWKDFGNILPIEGDLPVGPTEGEFNVMYITQDGDSISSETVMLHLPVAPEIAGFTFLKWQVVAGDLENGIIIQAVYQANEYTSAPEVYTNPANPAQKLIRNGNVYILTDDKIYSITGQTVR